MEHSEKIQLIASKTMNKSSSNCLAMLLKLAEIKGFNSLGHLRKKDGTYSSNTNVLDHIINSILPKDIPPGRDEFLALLKEAKFDKNCVQNTNVRSEAVSELKPFVFASPKIPDDHTQVRVFAEEEALPNQPKKTYVKRLSPVQQKFLRLAREKSARKRNAPQKYSPSPISRKKK